jgi:hypothetical protein
VDIHSHQSKQKTCGRIHTRGMPNAHRLFGC